MGRALGTHQAKTPSCWPDGRADPEPEARAGRHSAQASAVWGWNMNIE